LKSVLKSFYTKPLVMYLVVALLAISSFAGPADAMFMSAAPNEGPAAASLASAGRAADLGKVQTALESKIIRQKLMDFGLSPDETMARLNSLSDEQIHQLATHADSLQAGGDAVGVLASLLVIALLVVLLIFLVQGRVTVR
jgi:Family of unknown function (DUF6627)